MLPNLRIARHLFLSQLYSAPSAVVLRTSVIRPRPLGSVTQEAWGRWREDWGQNTSLTATKLCIEKTTADRSIGVCESGYTECGVLFPWSNLRHTSVEENAGYRAILRVWENAYMRIRFLILAPSSRTIPILNLCFSTAFSHRSFDMKSGATTELVKRSQGCGLPSTRNWETSLTYTYKRRAWY